MEKEILNEFNKKFPELWSSNDGREGYDSRVESDVMDFLLSAINRAYEEGCQDGFNDGYSDSQKTASEDIKNNYVPK